MRKYISVAENKREHVFNLLSGKESQLEDPVLRLFIYLPKGNKAIKQHTVLTVF